MLPETQRSPRSRAGVVRDVGYLGSVTRYTVELDGGETLVVLRQNLDTSAAEARKQLGSRVLLEWREEDEAVLESDKQEEQKP
jgi:ABC-type Fe3+/spermidine/putrescine transport system ATPase subunit